MKLKDASDTKKDTQVTFRPFRSQETEQQPSQEKDSEFVLRKDLYLVSFFGFLMGGVLILGLLFLTGAITGDAVLGLPGEKAVVNEETTAPVIEPAINETIANTTSSVVENTTETVTPELVQPDPCGPENEITLVIGSPYTYNGREIDLKLASDFAAQLTVGGKKGLISVGETMDFNGVQVTLVDGSEADASAIIYVSC